MNRLDYIKYDEKSVDLQKEAKSIAEKLEYFIFYNFKNTRASSLALTKLEECYMWIGKAIRDNQIERNKITELQEKRSNS